MAAYIGIIHKDADSDYGVSFPDFPGCVTAGATLDEAGRMAGEALRGHVTVAREHGDGVPEPMSLEAALGHELAEGAVAFLVVPLEEEGEKSVRLNITLPRSLVRQVDEHAKKRGLSRSGFLAKAAARALGEDSRA